MAFFADAAPNEVFFSEELSGDRRVETEEEAQWPLIIRE
jgi:hypothetical protein